MTAPKLPEGLEPVAFARKWWADGEKAVKVNGKWPGKFKLHAVTERQCLPDDAPLVRLSDAQAALQALAAEHAAEIRRIRDIRNENAEDCRAEIRLCREEIAALKQDAARWQYVRHHWANVQMFWNNDATNSLKSIILTIKTAHWTSGAGAIERQIDSAIALAAKEAK